MSISQVGALIHAKPAEARQRILDAIEAAEGDRQMAAKTLGTTIRSLYRFFDRLNLWDDIDKLIQEKGFLVVHGPPRLRKRIHDAIVTARGDVPRAARSLKTRVDILYARLDEYDLWDGINRDLRAAGVVRLVRPKRDAAVA